MAWLERSCEGPGVRDSLKRILALGYLSDEHSSVVVHDLEKLQGRLSELRNSFPQDTLHTLAIKTNPVLEILKIAVEAGFGLEAASSGEIALARASGCPAQRIVFDSPAKTRTELRWASSQNFILNANSRAEIERIRDLGLEVKLGLRCNPGSVAPHRASATMVATEDSKFGVSLSEAEVILRLNPQITGLHVHVGSQVATLDDLVEAVVKVVALAQRYGQISWLDIGGGLPTRYRCSDPGLHPRDYWARLGELVPELEEYHLITEMGRALQANCGWAASRVEYVSEHRAILQFGADFALRACYHPADWWHEMEVFTSKGEPKNGSLREIDLYGPLCFSGDRLAERRPLPELEEGDIVVMHDCGAYCLGMWSRYCSREMPAVLGLSEGDIRVLRRRETADDLVDFWTSHTS